MPTASRTQHRVVTDTGLPYITNSSVISTTPQFVEGSKNILTSLREWSERRPGFSKTLEKIASSFVNLQRVIIWRRWVGSSPNGGAFIAMFCDIGTFAQVLKCQLGVDNSAISIWTSTSSEPFDFVVSNNTCYFGNGTDMKKWDSATLSNWGVVAPAAGPGVALIAGTSNIFTSWCYCATYFNSNTQHESSPSPISACSGVFANKTVQLSLTASTDPQVTNIRVYRTPDGGAQDPSLMQEIAGSPFPNTTTTQNDSTPDVSLSIRTAPAFNRNDPPPPQKGFIHSDVTGRIWGFAGNTTYYSGAEEISNGVPEECWPSGLAGNFYPWANEVMGLAPLLDGVAIFQAEKISKVEGDTLDTFRRYTLLERRGTRSRTSIASLGGSVAWLDTSNTIWVSDIGEVGLPIRPDLEPIDPTTCYLTPHISGIEHWLVVLDGAGGTLYVFDLDRRQWMPPWRVGQTASALFSGETSLGIVDLILARNNSKVLTLEPGTYNDDGNTYEAVGATQLDRLTPDGNPSWKGVHDWTEIKTDAYPPTQVLQLTDDDSSRGAYVDITANGEPSPDITQGKYLQTFRYTSNSPTAEMMAMKYIWEAADSNFHVYQLDDSFHSVGE